MQVVNLDHHNTMLGGVGCPWDRACVIDEAHLEPHPITGEMQPKVVFFGTLEKAKAFKEASA
jgi:hypothetical protein